MLGANGSCMWQMSISTRSKSSCTVRETSSGTAALARARPGSGGSASPTARTRGAPPSPASRSSPRTARRPSRTRSCEPDGATIRTRWPRAASSAPTRRTWSLTSCPDSQGYGVTWAMVNGPGTAGQHSARSRPRRLADAPSAARVARRTAADGVPLGGGSGLGRRLGGGLRRAAALRGRPRPLARVLGDELLGRLARLVVGALVLRRLHEVRARAVELAGEAMVEAELAEPHRVDDDARRVRRVPHLELHLEVERHVAEGLALDADVGPLAVGEPGHEVGRADVDVVLRQLVAHDRGDRVRLGNLLGLEPLALEHVVEVHVAADVELRGAQHLHAALVEEARERAVDDRRADLRLDVVADDRQAGLAEAPVPVVLARDEDRDAVHEGAAGLEDLLDVPLRGLLGADREVGDDDVGVGLLEDRDDVGRLALGLRDLLGQVLAEAVVRHAAVHGDAELLRHLGELDRVVRIGPDRLAEILADLRAVDVERARELDVADVVAAEVDVHEPRHPLGGVRVGVVLDALHERVRAVADADDRDADLVVLVARLAVGGGAVRRRGVSVSVPAQSVLRFRKSLRPSTAAGAGPLQGFAARQAAAPPPRRPGGTWEKGRRAGALPG